MRLSTVRETVRPTAHPVLAKGSGQVRLPYRDLFIANYNSGGSARNALWHNDGDGNRANQILTLREPPARSAAVRADGAFVLAVTADPKQRIKIYASDDLANWVEVGEWTGNGQAMELPPLEAARFFKAEVVG